MLTDKDLYAAGFTRLLLQHDTTTDPPRVGFRADKDGYQVVGWEADAFRSYVACPQNMQDIIAPNRKWPAGLLRVEGDVCWYRLADLPHITERWRLGTTRGPDGSLTYERTDEETVAHYLQGLEAKPGAAEQSSEHRTPNEGAQMVSTDPRDAPAAPRVIEKGMRVLVRYQRDENTLADSYVREVTPGGNVYVTAWESRRNDNPYSQWIAPEGVVEVLP